MSTKQTSDAVIRVATDGYMTAYLKYAHKLVNEDAARMITVTGSGGAIENAVLAAELIKRSFPGLHQQTTIGIREYQGTKTNTANTDDAEEPQVRQVPYVEIKLSFDDNLDKNHKGYQTPIDAKLVKTDQQELLKSVSLPRHSHGARRQRGGAKKPVVEA